MYGAPATCAHPRRSPNVKVHCAGHPGCTRLRDCEKQLGENVVAARVSGEAKEQLRTISDPSVVAEILHLIYNELEVPPRGGSLDGLVSDARGSLPPVWWRRAFPFARLADFEQFTLDEDEDEFGRQACDYVIVYRLMTSDERIRFQISYQVVLVVAVYSNADLVPYLS